MSLWVLLLAIAVGVAFIAEKIKQPYPTLLVTVGLIIGYLPFDGLHNIRSYVTNDHIFTTAVVAIFLSALLGDSSLKLPFAELKKNHKPIILLSFAGTLLTFVLIALLSYYLLHLTIQQSLLFGALMSATDTVSVLSIFKTLKLSPRLSIIIEGESLANDGVSVILYKTALVTTALTISGVIQVSLDFVIVMTGGIFIGGALGYLVSKIISHIDNYLIETAFSILLFYGSFEISDMVHASGVVAVVVAGLIFGRYGRRVWMSPHTLERVDSFWETIAFLANSLIFLMVGMEISKIGFKDKWQTVILSILIVLLARIIAVFVSLSVDRSIPTSWKWLMSWGGLKGSLSIALALSVSWNFDGKNLITALTFSNVMFSLLVQGTTIRKVVEWLKIK